MINIRDLVENKDKYLKGFQNKGLDLTTEVEKVIELQNKLTPLFGLESDTRAELNQLSKEIGKDPKNSDLKKQAGELSSKAKEISQQIKDLSDEIKTIASHFPQLPMDDVVIGKDEDDNVVLEEFGKITSDNKTPHWDILESKGLTLNEEAGVMSGSRQVIYNDKAAKLVKAIERLMLDMHNEAGYKIIEPPVIVNEEALYNTGQLPKFEEDLFKLTNGQYLIPTAEVPLTNISANKIYKEDELPIKLTGSTQCFRSEAGSAGRDTRGIIRLHQFRKVELVKFGKPSDEEKDFGEMLEQASKVLDVLGLPYRHLLLCTGDMSFGSRKTVDIEVWMPGQDRWVEISSVSTIGDFQARRLKARVDIDGKKELIYTYNGSALAIGRTIAAILENYYDEKADVIKIPEALHKYLDFKEI